jgi:hypothetical protein
MLLMKMLYLFTSLNCNLPSNDSFPFEAKNSSAFYKVQCKALASSAHKIIGCIKNGNFLVPLVYEESLNYYLMIPILIFFKVSKKLFFCQFCSVKFSQSALAQNILVLHNTTDVVK